MSGDINKINEKLELLKKAYSQKVKTQILELKKFLTEDFAFDDVYSIVHSISGTSGMFGLKEVSATATEFEFFLKEIKDSFDSSRKDLLLEKLGIFIDKLELLGL